MIERDEPPLDIELLEALPPEERVKQLRKEIRLVTERQQAKKIGKEEGYPEPAA